MSITDTKPQLKGQNVATVNIFRYDPSTTDEAHYDSWQVPITGSMTVLDLLFYILEHEDGSLAFRYACREAICGSCALYVNGTYRLACKTQLKDLKATEINISPLPHLKVIKDLVVDMDPFWEKYERIRPYLITRDDLPEKEFLQDPADRLKMDDMVDCILCGACYSSCPQCWTDPEYLGPAALVKMNRFTVDTRDQANQERTKIFDNEHGVWRCHTIFNCVEACPKDINQTYSIQHLKRRAVARRFGGK